MLTLPVILTLPVMFIPDDVITMRWVLEFIAPKPPRYSLSARSKMRREPGAANPLFLIADEWSRSHTIKRPISFTAG